MREDLEDLLFFTALAGLVFFWGLLLAFSVFFKTWREPEALGDEWD